MTAGTFRRIASFIVDFMIIISLVFTVFRIFVDGTIREFTGYDETLSDWPYAAAELNEERDTLRTRLEEDDTYTREDFDRDVQELEDHYNEVYAPVIPYLMSTFLYFYFGWIAGNYIYQGLMKGRTFGRKWLKIELGGRVTWWTLFMREVLWKGFFWFFTVSFGIWLDFVLISFTQERKTLRDRISGNRVILEDVPYPI